MNLRKVGYQLLLHHPEDHSPQNRPPDRANAADHRHQQDVNTGLECEYSLGIDESGIACEDAAGNAGKRSRNGVNGELVSERIDAEIGGGVFILLDGFQCHAEFAVRNQERCGHGQRRHGKRRVVVLDLAKGTVLHDAKAAGTAGD